MSHPLTVELSDAAYATLELHAKAAAQPAAELAAAVLEQCYGANGEHIATDLARLDIDAWAKSMNLLCADSLDEDEESMHRAIEEHRRQAKERSRRDMGLSA